MPAFAKATREKPKVCLPLSYCTGQPARRIVSLGLSLSGTHILQTLCAVVQHHLQLIKQLQQQMWALLGSPGPASASSVLLGLRQRYTRTAEAMLTCAAPISIVGRATLA